MARYAKFFAALGGVIAIVADALADGVILAPELEAIIIAAVSAVFVYQLKNADPAPA